MVVHPCFCVWGHASHIIGLLLHGFALGPGSSCQLRPVTGLPYRYGIPNKLVAPQDFFTWSFIHCCLRAEVQATHVTWAKCTSPHTLYTLPYSAYSQPSPCLHPHRAQPCCAGWPAQGSAPPSESCFGAPAPSRALPRPGDSVAGLSHASTNLSLQTNF